MPRRNDISKILIIGSVLLLLATSSRPAAMAQSHSNISPRKIALVRCTSGFDQAGERIFANPGLKSWQEYAKVEDVPSLAGENGEQMFAVGANALQQSQVRLIESNPDASILQTYCYGRTGILRSLHYEIRTAWGWGYSEDRLFGATGEILLRTTRFFDTVSNQTISRPRQAEDVPDFLKPTVYSSFNSLPFIATFKAKAHAP
jgi:hypothetical protein